MNFVNFVKSTTFREFHEIHGFSRIPPVRARAETVPPLAETVRETVRASARIAFIEILIYLYPYSTILFYLPLFLFLFLLFMLYFYFIFIVVCILLLLLSYV